MTQPGATEVQVKVVFCPFCASATVCCLLFSTSLAVTYKGQQLCSLARQGYPAGKLPLGQWRPLANESYTCTGSGIMTVLLSSCQILYHPLLPPFWAPTMLSSESCSPSFSWHLLCSARIHTLCPAAPCQVVGSIKFLSFFECVCTKEDLQLDNKALSWERTDRCPL